MPINPGVQDNGKSPIIERSPLRVDLDPKGNPPILKDLHKDITRRSPRRVGWGGSLGPRDWFV